MRKAALVLLATTALLFMAGCGSQPPTYYDPLDVSAPTALTVTDTPPTGVTVLFFQLSITGATLTSQTVQNGALLSSANPIPFNVSQLQTESALLDSTRVGWNHRYTTGTYTGLTVTFANPQLTIYNGTGSAIGTCANNTVCQLAPTTTPLTLNFSSTPFPITLTADSPVAFKLDIHLNTIIQPDLTVNLAAPNGVTLSQLPAPPAGGPISALGRLIGTVQSVGANQFTLQTPEGRTFLIYVNSSTAYNLPDDPYCPPGPHLSCPLVVPAVCSAENLFCLMAGEVVSATVGLQSDGTLLATEVDYLQAVGQQAVEGTIVGLSTSGGNTIMDLILQAEPLSTMSSTLPLGQHVSVIVPSTGVTYLIDWQSFTPPSWMTLSFASASDLQVGQEVLVFVEGSVTTSNGSGTSASTPVGPAPLAFTTNFITLEPSQITGTVEAVDANSQSFTLQTLPAFFVPPSASPGAPPTLNPVQILIATTTQTNYEGLTPDDFSGVAVNDVVSVAGWLFKSAGAPLDCSGPSGCVPPTQVAAKAVLGRPGPTPLF